MVEKEQYYVSPHDSGGGRAGMVRTEGKKVMGHIVRVMGRRGKSWGTSWKVMGRFVGSAMGRFVGRRGTSVGRRGKSWEVMGRRDMSWDVLICHGNGNEMS